MLDHIEELYMALSECNADKQEVLKYLTCFEVSNTVQEVKNCVAKQRQQ